jgi:hypothetical protein
LWHVVSMGSRPIRGAQAYQGATQGPNSPKGRGSMSDQPIVTPPPVPRNHSAGICTRLRAGGRGRGRGTAGSRRRVPWRCAQGPIMVSHRWTTASSASSFQCRHLVCARMHLLGCRHSDSLNKPLLPLLRSKREGMKGTSSHVYFAARWLFPFRTCRNR